MTNHLPLFCIQTKNEEKQNTFLLSKFSLPILIFYFFSFMGMSQINAQTPFASLVFLAHSCGEDNGTVEFELNGNPTTYTYFWLHGPNELSLSDLAPGVYTLIVIDINGCKEEYEIEILDVENCYYEHHFQLSLDPKGNCRGARLIIEVFSSNGTLIDESSLIIEWENNVSAGLVYSYHPLIPIGPTEVCVSITTPGGSENCCQINNCFELEYFEECETIIQEPPVLDLSDIIVNEFNGNDTKGLDFIELLVIGNGYCGETTDLRGFHIDDNNGALIQGNDFISETNPESIGINAGFLSFRQKDNWAAVPNGSLILIYNSEHEEVENLPIDDPLDVNGDGVYILPATYDDLLSSKSGVWDEVSNQFKYEGYLMTPNWEVLAVNAGADGMQVRYPDGTISHGYSFGQNGFSTDNSFPLWITEETLQSCNCQFVQSNYFDKEHITCLPSDESISSPGLPNSEENAAIIALLTENCEAQDGFLQGNTTIETTETQPLKDNELIIYPNPFTNELSLDFKTIQKGMVSCSIFSTDGQKLMEKSWIAEDGRNSYQLEPSMHLPTGVLVLQFDFPSGARQTIRLTRIH